MLMGAIIGAVVGGLTLFILAMSAKKMVPQAREALASRPDGMTLTELGQAVGLSGTFQRGKLQQLANALVADGVEASPGPDGEIRYRVR